MVLVVYSPLLCFMPILSKLDNNIIITQNQLIKDDETLVSAAETFEAGFFSFGNSTPILWHMVQEHIT